MIKIDEHEIRDNLGEPTDSQGFFSNNSLAGIRLNLENMGEGDQQIIEDLTARGVVNVQDPFTGKAYRASIRQSFSRFTVGENTKSYVIEITELDMWPDIEELEIEGEKFKVIKYEEFKVDGEIGRKAILRLSLDEFQLFRSMLSNTELGVRRGGVDEHPLSLRFGARMFWSEHEEDGEKYWKHIVRLYPVEKGT